MQQAMQQIDVAVIGAGMAGLSCAAALAAAGRCVSIFDKSRGVGGRMATRRSEQAAFDHGAQYFTAKHPDFQAAVAGWQAAGVVAEWQAQFRVSDAAGQAWRNLLTETAPQVAHVPRYVATPRMSALGRHLLADFPFYAEHRLTALATMGEGWRLCFDGQPDCYANELVLALPAPQLAALWSADLPDHNHIQHLTAPVNMQPTWAVMLTLARPLSVAADGLFVNHGALSWVANNSSKPDRAASPQTWVLHASPAWSQAHVDASAEQVIAELSAAFCALFALDLDSLHIQQAQAHRWLYALAEHPLQMQCHYNANAKLGLVGDWLHGSRVEGAWLSGQALAQRMLAAP